MDAEEGEGWTLEEANEVETWYRRYLFLAWKYHDFPVVPSKAIDAFWHQHILDTYKYAEDCERVFGYFLHHFPYFGMRGEEDAANLQNSFEETNALFEREFGESPATLRVAGSSQCDSCGKGSCGHGCRWCGKCKGDRNPMKVDVRPTLSSIRVAH